jgi:hypothetical protein
MGYVNVPGILCVFCFEIVETRRVVMTAVEYGMGE